MLKRGQISASLVRSGFKPLFVHHALAFKASLSHYTPRNARHAAIDSTGFDRDQPSRHYVNRTHYRARALKVTALVDVETLYITDIHSTTSKKHDTMLRRIAFPSAD